MRSAAKWIRSWPPITGGLPATVIPRCGQAGTEARLLKAFGSGLELMEGAEAAGDPLATLPVLFHLMSRRELTAELSLVLSHRTVVRSAGGG